MKNRLSARLRLGPAAVLAILTALVWGIAVWQWTAQSGGVAINPGAVRTGNFGDADACVPSTPLSAAEDGDASALSETSTPSVRQLSTPSKPLPTSVRVVLRWDGEVRGRALPEPELLRLDAGSGVRSLRSSDAGRRGPAAAILGRGDAVRDVRQSVRTFEVPGPGRYAAAWHLWLPVPGTRTWRAVRGRGPELWIDGRESRREVVVSLDASQLVLDATLDAPARSARTTRTAKDGG